MTQTQWTYTFPKSMGGEQIVIRELRPQEMSNIMEATASFATMTEELVKRCIVKVGITEVTGENRDKVWHGLSAKQREMVNRAYRKHHLPDTEEDKDFFASESIAVSE